MQNADFQIVDGGALNWWIRGKQMSQWGGKGRGGESSVGRRKGEKVNCRAEGKSILDGSQEEGKSGEKERGYAKSIREQKKSKSKSWLEKEKILVKRVPDCMEKKRREGEGTQVSRETIKLCYNPTFRGGRMTVRIWGGALF